MSWVSIQDITLRLSPSVDPKTHELTSTGILDTKFGFSIETGGPRIKYTICMEIYFLHFF